MTGKSISKTDYTDKLSERYYASEDLFPFVKPTLSPEERVLFTNINKSFASYYKANAEQTAAMYAAIKLSEEEKIHSLKNMAAWRIYKGVRAAAKLQYADTLFAKALKEEASGQLTRKDLQAIQEAFSVKPLTLGVVGIVADPQGNIKGWHTKDSDYSSHDKSGTVEIDSVGFIEKLLGSAKLSEKARKVARQVFNEMRGEIQAFDKAVNVLGSRQAQDQSIHEEGRVRANTNASDYTEGWMLTFFSIAKLYNKEPAFSKEADKDSFARILAHGLSGLVLNANGYSMPESEIYVATSKLADKVARHDTKLTAKQTHAEASRARNLARLAERKAKNVGPDEETVIANAAAERDRQQAMHARHQQELIQHAEKRRLEYETFMASPQPYQFEPEAARIIAVLDGLASGGGFKAHNAKSLLNAVRSTHALLDVRDEGLKELGGQLLSAASLYTAAKSAGLADSIKSTQQGGNDSLNERSKRIRRQYHTSDTVKQAVDSMLADNDMSLLVAVHAGSPDHCGRYAAAMGDTARTMHKLVNDALYAKARLGNYSEAEFKELLADPDLRTDPDINKLVTNLAEQDAAKAKLSIAREALVAEVRQTFDGVPPRRIGNGTGGITIQKTAVEERVPNIWFKHLGDDFHLQESAKGDKFVAVHSNKYPQLSTMLKINTPEPELISAISHLNNECGAHEANRKIRKGLHKDAGFSVTEENGVTVMKHNDYGIRVPLEGSELDKARALSKAMYAFGLKQFEQDSMLRTLKLAGIDAEQSSTATGKATDLKLPDGSHVTLAPRGYFSADDFAIAQGLLGQLHANGNGNGAAEPAQAAASGTESWIPGKGDNVIVFDANVLRRLSVSRGGNHGKTWVDIVKETAKLPGVTVVVPEVVVFELTGKIPTKGQNGDHRHYKLVDQSYTYPDLDKATSAKHIEAFLDSASYGQIENNGEATIKGARNNVVVMSTPEDVDLYRKIQQQVLSAPEAERAKKLSELIYHNDEGEQAIARIVRALPGANYAVVTDDITYVNKSGYAVRTTTQGKPVVYAGTGAYLDAEINASRERYRALAKGMHCTQALSLYQVAEDIVKGGQGLSNYNDPIMRYSTHGHDPETGQDIDIRSIIADAAARSVSGHAGGNGATGNGWAQEGLKRSGLSAEITRRAGQDEGRLR